MTLGGRLRHFFRPANRRRIIGPWIIANLGYDVVHTLVVVAVFGRYGLVWWVYGLYVLFFSMIYAWSTLELIGALADRRTRRAAWLAPLTLAAYLAPETYIISVSRKVPTGVWVVLAVYVLVAATLTTVGLVRRYRAKKVTPVTPPEVSDDAGCAGP